jgi:hypothetical protein
MAIIHGRAIWPMRRSTMLPVMFAAPGVLSVDGGGNV